MTTKKKTYIADPSIVEETIGPARINNSHDDDREYTEAIRRAVDRHFARPRSLLIEPELVVYALQTHDYNAMERVDRDNLNKLRIEIERVQRVIASGLFLQSRNPDGSIDGPTCPSCYNNLHGRNPTLLLPCGHVYCADCIQKYIADCKSSKGPKCLKCNTTFNPPSDCRRAHLEYNQI